MPHGLRDDPKLFLAIAGDGTVTFTCHRSRDGSGRENGAHAHSGRRIGGRLASKLRITQAPGDEEKYGNQDTDGSRTTRHHFLAMRRIGGSSRG